MERDDRPTSAGPTIPPVVNPAGADATRVPLPTTGGHGDATDGADRNSVTRQVAAALGHVAIVTALLVYFGWVRSEVQARRLGIDESILGMSTRDYLLRSVRPVLVLLIVVALSGLVWVALDRWLTLRLIRKGSEDRAFRCVLRLLPAAAPGLPLAAWLAGFLWPTVAYIFFPLCCAGGLLVFLYAFNLRQSLPGAVAMSAARESLLRACTAAIVGVALFTAAANYATVEGTQLADAFKRQLPALPRVVVYSAGALYIEAPGVQSEQLGDEAGEQVRYTGLRLLERTGGRHFLVSDGWTPQYGVVVVLDDDDNIRLEFVRDIR